MFRFSHVHKPTTRTDDLFIKGHLQDVPTIELYRNETYCLNYMMNIEMWHIF